MLRLVTEGPGWTDDTAFFRWVGKNNGQPRLIGYESSSGTSIIFTNQSFDDAVAALLAAGQWDNEDDGTSNYIEGDTPDLFNAVDWYEDDDATEDEFFEDAVEFNNVSDYLEQLGYDSGEVEDLSEYALSKNCEGYEDLENYYNDEEIKGYIDNAYDCIFGGGYYNVEDTTFVLYEDYIEIFVNGKSEGKFEISYDSSDRAYRLYTYND